MKTFRLLLFILPGLALLASGAGLDAAAPPRPASTLLAPADFTAGDHAGTVASPAGLTLAPGTSSGTYESPPLNAPFPFNAAFPAWEAEATDEHDFLLEVRTRGGGAWSAWQPSRANPDWIQPGDPDMTGEMIMLPAAEGRHLTLQYRVHLAGHDGEPAPRLRRLSFTFVDSTTPPDAPAIEPLLPETPAPGYPKPPVVPRSQWCDPYYPECNYSSEDLEYVSVNHLVVHHTVTSGTDYPAVVRAIWSFHTFSRGWGDVGYNYLVDPNGTIYEGHLGGDDVVGTHAGNANHGSMGTAMIGDFTSATPSEAMKNSLANLLAWKADQKSIDPLDASRLPDAGSNVEWGLPNLMGHRDVFGGTNTACPGETGFDILPWLRTEVASRAGFASDFIYVEEWANGADTPIFTRSNANWYTAPGKCGRTGHAYYTFSTTDPGQSVNWGTWRPDIPADGSYELWVYAPYCDTDNGETYAARYDVHHAGGVSADVTVDMQSNIGLWMNLGTYSFLADDSGYLYLDDLTSDSGRGIWFDAIRLRPLSATVANEAPADDAWLTDRFVDFSWNLVNLPDVSSVALQAASDPGFANLVATATLPMAESHTQGFTADYANVYWRVLAYPIGGAPIVSAATRFGLDSRYPETEITGVVQTGQNSFLITWGGMDATSGISRYNIDVWGVGDAAWTRWLSDWTATSATFVRPDSRVYWFRSQAIDNVGNVEPMPLEGDRATGPGPNFPVEKILLPIFDYNR